MNYYMIDKQGNVVNTIVWDGVTSLDLPYELVPVPQEPEDNDETN